MNSKIRISIGFSALIFSLSAGAAGETNRIVNDDEHTKFFQEDNAIVVESWTPATGAKTERYNLPNGKKLEKLLPDDDGGALAILSDGAKRSVTALSVDHWMGQLRVSAPADAIPNDFCKSGIVNGPTAAKLQNSFSGSQAVICVIPNILFWTVELFDLKTGFRSSVTLQHKPTSFAEDHGLLLVDTDEQHCDEKWEGKHGVTCLGRKDLYYVLAFPSLKELAHKYSQYNSWYDFHRDRAIQEQVRARGGATLDLDGDSVIK